MAVIKIYDLERSHEPISKKDMKKTFGGSSLASGTSVSPSTQLLSAYSKNYKAISINSNITAIPSWPDKWEGPDFNAKGNDVAIETLTLSCEGIDRADDD